jgi:hypothetical protein
MGFFEHIIAGAAYMALLLLDLTILFSVIRMMARRWPHQWLRALDQIGRPLIDLCLQYTDLLSRRFSTGKLRETQLIVLSLCVLVVIRTLLAGILRLLMTL